MFGSEVLDVAIGLIFIYLVLSLICSAACELIESFSRRRSLYLHRGLQELLNDPMGLGLVREIYQHPLVSSLYRGTYQASNRANFPSYIPPRNFALALMDVIGSRAADGGRSGAAGATLSTGTISAESLRSAIVTNLASNPQASQALLTLAEAAGYDPVKLRENIEAWYNSSMDRVAGWFKRRSHMTVLIVGIVLSVAINADTISIANSLATDKALRTSLVRAAAESAKRSDAAAPASGALPDEFTRTVPACQVDVNSADCRFQANLRRIRGAGLPLGWSSLPGGVAADPRGLPQSASEWAMKLLGVLLTALAISLGSPFWFDTLNKVMVIRSTVKPKEKSQDEESKS
jgi:hypothetical protein